MEDNGNKSQRNLKFICPTCKTEKELLISESIISQSKNLTTISIQKNEICDHHFQAFVDKDFKIRGYQKVDFEIVSEKKYPKGDFIMKVVILGDYMVGKSAITRRFVEDTFEENYLSTLHMEISKVKKTFGETNVTYMCWDIGGQALPSTPSSNRFYDGAQSIMIVVDRTRKSTLENAEKWYKNSAKYISRKIPFFLVGNKSDLAEDIVINEEDLKDFAEKLDINYTFTSAKTGENIENLFTILTQMCFESQNF